MQTTKGLVSAAQGYRMPLWRRLVYRLIKFILGAIASATAAE